jgi:hypothetical protein
LSPTINGGEVYFAESGFEATQALAQHPSIGMVLIVVALPDIEASALARKCGSRSRGVICRSSFSTMPTVRLAILE